MAEFHTYVCPDCGYDIITEPDGHYALFSGSYSTFFCSKCKEVHALQDDQLLSDEAKCPSCNQKMTSWNPINGHCPKCGGKLVEDGPILMAD